MLFCKIYIFIHDEKFIQTSKEIDQSDMFDGIGLIPNILIKYVTDFVPISAYIRATYGAS